MRSKLCFMGLLLCLPFSLLATTPFNLEGLKALNVLVIDQSNAISSQLEKRLLTDLCKNLEANGIKSSKDDVGTLFVKLMTIKVGEKSVVHISLGVGEESHVKRMEAVESYVLTYSFEDMIVTEDINKEVYDTVMNYLLEEFLEQFHEDNNEEG